jgi:hypothetical protein
MTLKINIQFQTPCGLCRRVLHAEEYMTDKSLLKIEKQIDKIKQELIDIGEMRPGSLTKQYHNAKEKKWGFYQLSYTYIWMFPLKTNVLSALTACNFKQFYDLRAISF